MEFADDTHLCLRCSETIVGLDNYVLHRQQPCLVQNVLQTCKSLPCENSSLLPNVSTQHHISANDFFTSLELQSKAPAIIPFAPIEFDAKINDVFEYVTPVQNGLFTDLKSIKNGIDLPEKADESDGDDPPPTYTGGKWKPGFGPHNSAYRKSPTHGQKPYFNINIKQCENNSFEYDSSPSVVEEFVSETHDRQENKDLHDSSLVQNETTEAKSDFEQRSTDSSITKSIRNSRRKTNNAVSCELCDVHNLDSCSMFVHLLSKKHKLHFKNDIERRENMLKFENVMLKNCAYQCHLCSYYFNEPSAILHHVRTTQHRLKAAQSKRNLICLPCEFECLGNDDIVKHLSKGHYFLPYSNHPLIITEKQCNCYCEHCKRRCQGLFPNLKSSIETLPFLLTDHLNITEEEQSNHVNSKCPFCDFLIENTADLGSHLIKVHHDKCSHLVVSEKESNDGIGSVNCKIPIEQIINNDAKEEPTGSLVNCSHKSIKCLICGNRFRLEHFYRHVSMHHGEQPKYGRKRQLNAGVKSSKDLRKTSEKSVFLKHKATHLDQQLKPFTCSHCSSSFSRKKLLRQHEKLHSAPKHKCTVCARVFHINSELTRHMKTHSDIYPYLCDMCGYRSKVPQLLKRHIRVHTKEHPFRCKQCSFSAATCSQLLRHERIHSGSKPYNCPHCSYTCNTQENLRKHILKTKKHKDLKMYTCNFCAFQCNIFHQYRNHLLNQHKSHFPNGEKDITSLITVNFQSNDHEDTVEFMFLGLACVPRAHITLYLWMAY